MIHLCKIVLWKGGLKYVRTLRKNMTEIPPEFLPNNSRAVCSSLFAFNDITTLTSYVPKKNKAVLLISSHHHDSTVESSRNNKPKIILYYNLTKGGVDTLDQLVGSFSCKRKTNLWTFAHFCSMLDNGGYDAYVLGILY